MLGHVARKAAARGSPLRSGGAQGPRQYQPALAMGVSDEPHHRCGVGRKLSGISCRLAVDHYRLLDRYDVVKLGQSNPKIPILYAGNGRPRKTDLIQARAAENYRRAGNEVLFQQFPKDIALRTRCWKKVICRNTVLITQAGLPVDERSLR